MTRFRVWPALALAAGLIVAVGGSSAQQPRVVQFKVIPGQPKVVPMPAAAAELPLVPKSSSAFISLKVADVVDHPDLKAVLEQLKKTPEVFDGLTEAIGLNPLEIDRITLFWPVLAGDGPEAPVLVVTTREAYNEARVLKSLRAVPVFDGQRNRHRHDHDPFGNGGPPRVGVKQGAPAFGGTPSKPTAPGPIDHPPLSKSVPPERFDPPKSPIPEPRPIEPEKKGDADDTVPILAAIPAEPLFYELERGGFSILFLVDERTLVFLPGHSENYTAMFALMGQLMQKKATGPLADAITAGGNHTFAAGVHLTPLFREFGRHMPGELAPYAALLSARTAVVTGDLGKSAKLSLKLTFDDAAAARRAGPVLEEGIRTVAGFFTEQLANLKANGRPADKIHLPVLEAAVAGLKQAKVKAEGSVVTASGEMDVGPAAAKAASEVLQSISSRKKYIVRTNNLKQIGLALHNYESAMGHLPGNVYGPKGEPLLSWRVELLPYLEQDNLYRQFRRDEPWDGPNNKKLIEQMPKLFEIPEREAPKGQTYFQAFLTPDPARPPAKGANQFFGRTWLVEGGKNRVNLSHIPDGTSNTLAVVEARDSVVWSKPDDLPFGEKLAPLGEAGAERFFALFLDGSVRAMSTKTKPETLRILIDSQDGQVIPDLGDDDDFPRLFPFFLGSKKATSSGPKAAIEEPAGIRELEEFNQLRNEFERSRAELARAEAEEAVAAAQLKRVTELFNNGAANKQQLDEAKAQSEVSQQRAKVAALRLREMEDRLAVVQHRLERLGVIPTKPAPRPDEKK